MEAKVLPSYGKANNRNNGVINQRETKIRRTDILEKKRTINHLIRTASSVKDQFAFFPAFRLYNSNGLSLFLESGRGDELSPFLKQKILELLKLNMKEAYGSEWPTEEKLKRRDMVCSEARYIFVYEENPSDTITTLYQKRKFSSTCAGNIGTMVGFVHYRFTVEEGVPVLYVYELQLDPCVQGKKLGNFLMQLIELIARKNHMSAVVLTVLKSNFLAMSFYLGKLRYNISAISPSKVDALMWKDKNYEILCKAFNQEAKACLEDEV